MKIVTKKIVWHIHAYFVKQQKSTLAAYIALKKNNVDIGLLYTVIKK